MGYRVVKEYQQHKIAVIDDEPDLLILVKKRLEANHYQCMTFDSTTGIIEKLLFFKPDIILLDLLMPGEGGLPLIKKIRGTCLLSHTPIIILTAFSKQETMDQAMASGASDYLLKTSHSEKLLEMIAQHIGQ